MINIKKKYIVFIGCGLIVLAIIVLYNLFCQNVNVDFTEKITYKYDNFEKEINVQIIDENDKNAIVTMCKGIAISNSPSCGFGSSEIIFEGRNKKISLYPACDGCDLMRVDDTEKYFSIGEENRRMLIEILEKYGAILPVVY